MTILIEENINGYYYSRTFYFSSNTFYPKESSCGVGTSIHKPVNGDNDFIESNLREHFLEEIFMEENQELY